MTERRPSRGPLRRARSGERSAAPAAVALALTAAAALGGARRMVHRRLFRAGDFCRRRPLVDSFSGSTELRPAVWHAALAISDDGSLVAYAGLTQLSIRRLRDDAVVRVANNSISSPFFSPNGDKLGFFGAGGVFRCRAPAARRPWSSRPPSGPPGPTWGPGGTIVFATTEGLYRVAENGGERELLKRPDPLRKERLYAWPQFMPDGQSVLFTVFPEGSSDPPQIASLDLKTLESKIVLSGGMRPALRAHRTSAVRLRQTPQRNRFRPQHARERAATPCQFRASRLRARRETVPPICRVHDRHSPLSCPETHPCANLALSWIDRQGVGEPLPLEPGWLCIPSISPYGTRVALDIFARQSGHLDLESRAAEPDEAND